MVALEFADRGLEEQFAFTLGQTAIRASLLLRLLNAAGWFSALPLSNASRWRVTLLVSNVAMLAVEIVTFVLLASERRFHRRADPPASFSPAYSPQV